MDCPPIPTVLRTVKTSVKVAALLSPRLDGPVDGMETESDTTSGHNIVYDIAYPAIATITLLGLLFATCILEGRDLGGEFIFDAIALPLAILVSSLSGRFTSLIPIASSGLRVSALASALLAFSLLANIISPTNFDHLFVTMFFITGLVSAILDECKRFEESSIFFSVIIGMHISVTYAAGLGISTGTTSSELLNVQRTAIGTAFFTFWLASISLGFLVLLAIRGALQERGSGKFFSGLPNFSESKTPVIYSSLVLLSFIIPLVWLGSLEELSEFSDGKHLGFVWGIFSALVVITHSFFRSEGWHVLGSVLAINWVLYTIAVSYTHLTLPTNRED